MLCRFVIRVKDLILVWEQEHAPDEYGKTRRHVKASELTGTVALDHGCDVTYALLDQLAANQNGIVGSHRFQSMLSD